MNRIFDAGVAQGLTASWSVSPALNIRARAEHVQPIAETFERSTAIGVGATWQPESDDWIADADLEYGAGENGRGNWYSSASYGRRWNDVTFLARNRFATNKGSGISRTRNRLRAGWAHRPATDDALNTLAWYEYEPDHQADARNNNHMWSTGGERKPGADTRYRGRLAGQYYSFTGGALDFDTVTLLAQAGIDRDLSKRWTVGANIAAITDGKWLNQHYGFGAEVNYVAAKNTMVGLGYNHVRLNEDELRGLYRAGWYLRLRVKLNQDSWNIFARE